MIARGLYRIATGLAAPMILRRRLEAGKEDPARFAERIGQPSRPRPDGPLVWIHAASNGESMSALPLIGGLMARDPGAHVLLTTGTVTSAKLMADRLPPGALHQYAPADRPAWVKAFFNHWRPDAGIWIESEFWPALIWQMRKEGRPMALVNGRVSARSRARWAHIPGLSADLLAGFAPCLAQTPADADHLRDLGAKGAECVGNLKLSDAPLPADRAELETLGTAVRGRVFWTAASTHPGEEAIVADAHCRLRENHETLLTCIVPRHPDRGTEIAIMLAERGLSVVRRSEAVPMIRPETDVYIADTLGELGLFFRQSDMALIGGSLCGGHGGHNPLEAARLSCAILHGPDMANFVTVAADLAEAGGAVSIKDAESLAWAADRLIRSPTERTALAKAAAAVAENGARTVDRVMARLAPILPLPAKGSTG